MHAFTAPTLHAQRKIRTNHDHIRKVLQLDDIKDRHWHIQECSAYTGYGLEVPGG